MSTPRAARYLRLRRLFWIPASSAAAAALCFVPLFNTLSYPFALAMAAIVSLGSAHLGSAVVAAIRDSEDALLLATRPPAAGLLILFARAVLEALLLLAVPLVLISLNALRVRTCDPLTGLAFFGLLPALGGIIAAVNGVLWALAIQRRALATAAAVLTVLASWAWSAHGVYASPAVFAFDPFFGYFPGVLYDEDVAVRMPLVLYRAHNLLWLSGILLASIQLFDPGSLRLRIGAARWSPRRVAITALCFTAAMLAWTHGSQLGFSTSGATIQRVLGEVRRTAHFDIHLPASTPSAAVELLAQEHEYRYAQLEALLGVTPGRVRSYVFSSAEQKRRSMGAAQTFLAKPWRKEIYLQLAGFPQPSLAHELAHVFAATFGDRLFGASVAWRRSATLRITYPAINIGLIEGLAVAASFVPRGEATVHEIAATQLRIGTLPPIERLMSLDFLAYPANRAYNATGSFCRFLLDRWGVAKLQAAYRAGGAFRTVYGRPLRELSKQWHAFLRGIEIAASRIELAREVFRRPSIFYRACPHTIASLQRRAKVLGAQRQHAAATRALEQVCAHEPEDPGHLLDLARALLLADDQHRAVTAARRALASVALTPPLAREAYELLGDLAWLADRSAEAAAHYRDAAGHAGWAAGQRALFLKRWALDQAPPVRRILRAYLAQPAVIGHAPVREVHLAHALQRALPSGGLGLYLAAKQLEHADHCAEAAALAGEALAAGLPRPEFEIEALRVHGACAYREGQLNAARKAFARLCARRDSPTGIRQRAVDWLDRIRWRTTGAVSAPAPWSAASCVR